MRILVLRPEPGASETVRKAREHGLEAIPIPLFVVEAVQWQVPDTNAFDAVLLTSANAVRHAGPGLESLKSLPVHAVGEATATAAQEAGFAIAHVGSAGVERLLAALEPGLRLLHLCGEERKQPLTPQTITSLIVYRAKMIEMPALAVAADTVALVHSPRAGRRFAELVHDRSGIAIAAISPAAAAAVGGGWKSVESAEKPTDDALLALAARLCNNQR